MKSDIAGNKVFPVWVFPNGGKDMKKGINWKKVLACVLVCVLTMALAAGCSPKKTEKPKKPEQNEEEVISEGETGENPAEDITEMPTPPAEGEMSETEVDALGNPINDDGYYYDEDGNLVSEEDMMNVDEDGNPISEEDMLYSEGGDDGWDSVEYGDKEAFAEAVKTGYEEVTELSFKPTGTVYYLYANGVYETQYESNTDFLTFCKGFTEDQVNRITVEYDHENTVSINDTDVRIQSYENVVYIALWNKGDYWYSIYCDQGCTEDEMVKMVSSVK